MAITTKTTLRTRAREIRNQLPQEVRSALSEGIALRLFDHPSWKGATTILGYASFGSEVETRAILKQALDDKKRLVLPLGHRTHEKQELCELHSLDDLVAGPHPGIVEPDRGKGALVAASEV